MISRKVAFLILMVLVLGALLAGFTCDGPAEAEAQTAPNYVGHDLVVGKYPVPNLTFAQITKATSGAQVSFYGYDEFEAAVVQITPGAGVAAGDTTLVIDGTPAFKFSEFRAKWMIVSAGTVTVWGE